MENISPGKRGFLIDYTTKREKEREALTKIKLENKLLESPAPKNVDTETRIAEALFPKDTAVLKSGYNAVTGTITAEDAATAKALGYDIPVGMERKSAIDLAMKQRDIQVQGAKVGAAEQAKLNVPEEVGKRTNIISVKALRGDNAIVHPPAGITKADMRKGDYIEISDVQMAAFNKLNTARGQAKLAFNDIRPYIKATSGAEAVKQAGELAYRGYAKGDLPEIRAYVAMKDALASIMARFVEVGVLTNTDVTRWSKSLPGLTETKGSFAAKERIFNELYGIASEAMKDSLLGTDPAKLAEKYQGKLGTLLNSAEKTATPESLQDDMNTLLKVK